MSGMSESAVAGAGPLPTRTAEPEEAYVVRFDSHQRLQHILMVGSFLTLAVTGLVQKFDSLGASQWLMESMGGIETVRLTHRIAGGVMILDGLYHIAYIVVTVLVLKKLGPLQMIPTPKDVRDALQMVMYYLGQADQKPRCGRFTYLEKFDYWAVFWGMAIMGGSGLVLLFPVQASRLIPIEIIPTAFTAHSDEAVLAVCWIFIVHIFYSHFAPGTFPFNPSIFTGRIRADLYAEEHPLEYPLLVEAGKVITLHRKAAGPRRPKQPSVAPPAGQPSSAVSAPTPAGQARGRSPEGPGRARRAGPSDQHSSAGISPRRFIGKGRRLFARRKAHE